MSSAPIRRARVGALAVLGVAAVAVTACTSGSPVADAGSSPPTSSSAVVSTSAASTPAQPSTTSAKPTPLGAPVKVSSVEADGQVYGVGLPIVIRFNVSPTSKAAFEKAATVTVNGAPAGGAWFWEKPYADSPMEVHYRINSPSYWPARAKIHVGLPVKGLSAGAGLSFANDLTLDYSTGDYHYSVVDATTLRMTVYNNGKPVRVIPVSLGAARTATYSGIKIVSQKNNPVRMQGPGYDELVAYSVRITNSGEYVHYAPWNQGIGATSTSNGCTNVGQADAIWFYNFALVGDVVNYPNAPGKLTPSWDGFGDWNLSWAEWLGGGALTK